MEKLTVIYEGGWDTEIAMARRFTEQEKEPYADWFKESGLVLIKSIAVLPHISITDIASVIGDRGSDGSFCGSNNMAFFVSDEEADALRAIEQRKAIAQEKREKEEEERELQLLAVLSTVRGLGE